MTGGNAGPRWPSLVGIITSGRGRGRAFGLGRGSACAEGPAAGLGRVHSFALNTGRAALLQASARARHLPGPPHAAETA